MKELLRAAVIAVGLVGLLVGGAYRNVGNAGEPELDAFLARIQSKDGNVRRSAWETAGAQGELAVGPLLRIASGEDKDAALAALRALDAIAHSSSAPDSPTDRKAVAWALAQALADSRLATSVKLHALDLLGSVGEDPVVPLVAKGLQDSGLRELARRALERIPGEASAKALLAAAERAKGEWRDALVLTLGTKRAACCLSGLTKMAEAGGDGSLVAAKALARIADPTSVPVILGAIKRAEPPERSRLTDDYVRMGDLLREAGQADLALRIYESVLAHSEDEGPRYAALLAIAGRDPRSNLTRLVDAMGDESPAVRALAVELLERVEGADVNQVLLERFAKAEGRRKAALLRMLAGRKVPGMEARIEAALGDADIDIRMTALDLAGRLGAAAEPALLEAMEKGSAPVKALAFRAYLDLADARAKATQANERQKAEPMYVRALEGAADPADRGRALVGLAAGGKPEHLSRIEAARKDPATAGAANQALVLFARAAGKAGDKEKAEAMLLDVIGSGASRETIQEALAGLKEIGGDPTSYQKKQGLIASWFVVGPFPNDGGRGFDQAYSPEEEVNLKEQPDARGRKRKWAEYFSPNLDGKVDLRQVFQRSNDVCAYAYTVVEVPAALDVKLKMGSDDGVVCWLNGKKVHANNAVRPWGLDSDVVDARLEEGRNTILLKITQGGGEWEFSFRIADREGRPIDLTACKMPLRAE